MVRVAGGSFHPSVSCVLCSSLNFRWAGSSLLFLQHLCRLQSELILEEQKSGAISNLLRKELGKRQTAALWHAKGWAQTGLSPQWPMGLCISVAFLGKHSCWDKAMAGEQCGTCPDVSIARVQAWLPSPQGARAAPGHPAVPPQQLLC